MSNLEISDFSEFRYLEIIINVGPDDIGWKRLEIIINVGPDDIGWKRKFKSIFGRVLFCRQQLLHIICHIFQIEYTFKSNQFMLNMAESLKVPRYRYNILLCKCNLGTKCLDLNLLDSGNTVQCTYVMTSDGQGGTRTYSAPHVL
jgi:hypothetical protein